MTRAISAAAGWRGVACILAALLSCGPAPAHDFKAGSIAVDHPYALPTTPGARLGLVYVRALTNKGPRADRLIGASAPVAGSIEFQRATTDGGTTRMQAVPSIELPAGSRLELRHGGDTHLVLLDLKTPLQDGQRFPLRLRFERAGELDVTVWVQTPRDRGATSR